MTPQLVGVKTTELPLGKLSGKHAFSEKLVALGYDVDAEEQKNYLSNLKQLLIRKSLLLTGIYTLLIQGTEHEQNAIYKVEALQLQFVSNGLQSAVVVIQDKDGNTYQDSSIGTGSIVSVYNAVDRIFNRKTELIDYRIESVTEGTDAQAEVHVQIKIGDQIVTGVGIDHDILLASCKSYVEAHAKYVSNSEVKEGIHS